MVESDVIHVSPEMVVLLGDTRLSSEAFPPASATFIISLECPVSVRVVADAGTDWPSQCTERTIALVVSRNALGRLFDWSPAADDGCDYFLDPDTAAIAAQIVAARIAPEAQSTYRLGKSIELLCELTARLKDGRSQPAYRDLSLSQEDSERLGTARAIIDAQWSQKLTLGGIARECGLNRSKLSRGFRELYRCSVGEALADRRLAEARRQLLATDLPVSVIGWDPLESTCRHASLSIL